MTDWTAGNGPTGVGRRTEVVRLPVSDGAVRTLRGPQAVLDPATAQVVAAAVADAERRARAEGERAGHAAAVDAATRAAEVVVAAVERLHAEVRDQRAAATAASLELAVTAAAAVLDRTPPDDATTVLRRIETAVDLLDDHPLEVRVHPDLVALLGQALEDRGARLVGDPTVALGDALVRGPNAGAELTRDALLTAAMGVLAGEDEV